MMATQIIYNGTVIGTVTAGQSKILKCNGKKMKSDVEIRAGERTEIKYDGAVIATVEAGNSKTIKCAGKTMKSNIEIRAEDDTPGKEGVSPTVEMIDIEGGTRIIITDVNGPKSTDIMDGKDGVDGKDGKDGYTPVKNVDYFDGKDGSNGKNGSDGVGIKSVVQTTTSSLDGGSNVITVTKTDNTTSTFTVKNGSKGSTGDAGKDGNDGKDGERGTSILRVTTAPSAYTTATGGFTPAYRIALSTLKTQASVDEVRVGDTILRNYYTYKVGYVDASYAYLTTYASIRGSAGTSVTISSTTESEADGGENVVTFSDGKTLTVKNGSKGSAGKDGSDGRDGADGKTPVKGVDYYTEADKSEFSEYIASELAKRGQLTPEYAESLEWLEANGDQSKMYVLPDGYIYAWMLTEKEVESGGGYTNLIDGTNGYIKKGYRYSASSQAFKEITGSTNAGAIIIPVPTSGDLTIRVRGMTYNAGYPTIYGGKTNTAFSVDLGATQNTYESNGDWHFTFTNSSGSSYIVTTGLLDGDEANVIATVNEEIVEGGTEIITEYDWANTGLAFVPADYEGRIIDLENDVAKNKTDIENLKKGITTSTPIKDWDSPIYDANIPVFELSVEKAAMTNAPCTPSDIYAKYDALMAKHPRYIKKTDLGLCSDGVNHVYRYDFREPEPLYESNKEWSETKAKAIIVTGIHFEWAGIYAMYNALEEIADNPELRNFRRNTHLIVVPCANPYATIVSNYQSGLSTPNSYGVRNANGVEIHRNFEVDWVLTAEGTTHYGGTSPLSEVETQYIDNIMKNNTDAALFLSCHNCGVDTFWGTGFIWASTATNYMCNMGYRVIDKLSDAWMDKYGDTLSAGIEEYKTDSFEDGETRLGWTGISTSPGTEAKQATKYGIQGTNVEICDPFQIHGTKANPEPSMSAFTMSRGAEVYVNFLLTAFGVYDPKDKKEYAPNLPWSE